VSERATAGIKVDFDVPTLRMRYRDGVTVNRFGFPDWIPYARCAVSLPMIPPGRGSDEARVVDVVTANAAGARFDPLWAGLGSAATPAGWTWAHLEMSRTLVLVPIELYQGIRHRGGIATSDSNFSRRGLGDCPGVAPDRSFDSRLNEEGMTTIEANLGVLPAAYRTFLLETNGAGPATPAVHPACGFVLDQPLFGFDRADRMQDLGFTFSAFADRLTADLLPIGYVHGGLLALRTGGSESGSVWWYDDDDVRSTAEDTAQIIADRLLRRCADTFDEFWGALRPVPARIVEEASAAVEAGEARAVALPRIGTALAANRRAPVPAAR